MSFNSFSQLDGSWLNSGHANWSYVIHPVTRIRVCLFFSLIGISGLICAYALKSVSEYRNMIYFVAGIVGFSSICFLLFSESIEIIFDDAEGNLVIYRMLTIFSGICSSSDEIHRVSYLKMNNCSIAPSNIFRRRSRCQICCESCGLCCFSDSRSRYQPILPNTLNSQAAPNQKHERRVFCINLSIGSESFTLEKVSSGGIVEAKTRMQEWNVFLANRRDSQLSTQVITKSAQPPDNKSVKEEKVLNYGSTIESANETVVITEHSAARTIDEPPETEGKGFLGFWSDYVS